jgi:aquaporin Z
VVAFVAEFLMSLVLMGSVLIFAGSKRLTPWIPLLVGILIGGYVAFEAPLSGMSINPARTFATAIFAHRWNGWWIYYTAPVLGMVAASQAHRLIRQRLAGRQPESVERLASS